MSATRTRFCCVASIFRSAASRRFLYFVMPAASSMIARRSSGRADTICPIRPCSMMEYAVRPTPEPKKMSFTSRSRASTLFTRYSDSPVRNRRRPTVSSEKPWYWDGSLLGRSFSKVSITSAIESGGFDSEPLKITFHRAVAQVARRLLAEHPADRVGDVRLPTPVRSDDPRDALVEGDHGPVHERFEADDVEPPDAHG